MYFFWKHWKQTNLLVKRAECSPLNCTIKQFYNTKTFLFILNSKFRNP